MGKKILVVDDEQRIVDLLYKFLSNEGFTVSTATDGGCCLKLAKELIPDLIVLDINMPGMDGCDVVNELLKDEKTKSIPVIFLTGAVTDEELIEGGSMIANHLFMSKGSDLNEQIRTIKQILGVSN